MERMDSCAWSSMAGSMNWNVLRRLLRDPYLERSVLMTGPTQELELLNWYSRVVDQRESFQYVEWAFDIRGDTWRKIAGEDRKPKSTLKLPLTNG